jgi:hypothetical protein
MPVCTNILPGVSRAIRDAPKHLAGIALITKRDSTPIYKNEHKVIMEL